MPDNAESDFTPGDESISDAVARISLADLRELVHRAFGDRMPIELTEEELELVNRLRRAMREAK